MLKTDFFRLNEQFFENLKCRQCGYCLHQALELLDGVESLKFNRLDKGIDITYDLNKVAPFEIEYFLSEKNMLWKPNSIKPIFKIK
jgi:hypothetical protein